MGVEVNMSTCSPIRDSDWMMLEDSKADPAVEAQDKEKGSYLQEAPLVPVWFPSPLQLMIRMTL